MVTGTAESTLRISVIIATYNRAKSVERLLSLLAQQTLAPDTYEVIVIDDGSEPPVEPSLATLETPYRLVLLRQANAGPGAARNNGILQSRGCVLVIVDDDMVVGPEFLAEHLAAHPPGSRIVALGKLLTSAAEALPLFSRFHLDLLDRHAAAVEKGRAVHGTDMYTGNVSLTRADYDAAGGFDPKLRLSEDAELGMRLEISGAKLVLCPGALASHDSDHSSIPAWLVRSRTYGTADARISAKHPNLRSANPWRFLFMVNPVSRPFLLCSALAPRLMRPVSWAAIGTSVFLDRIGAERAALAGATFVYGLEYYAGVGTYAGDRESTMTQLRRYVSESDGSELGPFARIGKLFADVRADHAAMQRSDEAYNANRMRKPHLLLDYIRRIGFQMMVRYRLMRLYRDLGLTVFAKIASRRIRYAYGAEIHWDTYLAPGVVIVHGNGLVLSHGARVGAGCILFHNVTLGESIDGSTREVGAPILEENVHVGAGATIVGPVIIGRGTKVMGGALLRQSVPPRSIVEVAMPTIRPRNTAPTAEP
jgi:serine acetyltransferase/GT2 family glycosyltransferase